MNHCLPPVQGGPAVQDPRDLGPGCQGHPLCPDFHIWSLCNVSYSMFKKCLAEPSVVIFCGLGTCACCGGSAGDRR